MTGEEKNVIVWIRTGPREFIVDAELSPETPRPSAAEGWQPLFAEQPETEKWRKAYYDITGVLGFPAMAMSPAQAHESVILPRVRELVASTKWLAHTKMMNALEVIRDADEDCFRDGLKRLSPYVRRMVDEALESGK